MDTTTVSTKFQVVIPLRVRRALGIRPGQKVQVIPYLMEIPTLVFTIKSVVNPGKTSGFIGIVSTLVIRSVRAGLW